MRKERKKLFITSRTERKDGRTCCSREGGVIIARARACHLSSTLAIFSDSPSFTHARSANAYSHMHPLFMCAAVCCSTTFSISLAWACGVYASTCTTRRRQ